VILLDTHVALWVDQSSGRLGARTTGLLESGEEVCFSSVTILEITIKRMSGRLRVPPDVQDRLEAIGLQELPLSARHAAALDSFPTLVAHDPFDRALVAQAQVERATFLTADRVLLGLERDWILDARS
jgi:PIN domain nuclease of toxin-antitoxin system